MGLAPSAEGFFESISLRLNAAEIVRVRSAWDVACLAHAGQTRESGEPYATHPLAVAALLFDVVGPDADALCAALLHDVVEDSDTSLSSICDTFGDVVAHIVDGVSKLDLVHTAVGAVDGGTGGASKEDTLRKLVAAGGRDWRVFAVKLCDRLHNMRTLGAVRREKQLRVSIETKSVFLPLARYVGLQQLASELEALSLRWLYPWRWDVVRKWLAYKSAVDRARLTSRVGGLQLDPLLRSSATGGRVFNELIVRCFKLLREDRACRALFAIPTVFQARPSIEAAYEDIAGLHRQFELLPSSFSSLPVEGVASSKVRLGRHALVAEVIFFFPQVARSAYAYSEDGSAENGDFSAMASSAGAPGDFTRVLREMVEQASISVFSPKGRHLSLPRHATGLDFAFAIHTDLGLRAKAVRINGVLRDAGTVLSSGDIVEVVADDRVIASPEWEGVLRSPRSRAKLRHWLREAARNDAAVLGQRLLADAAGIVGTDDSHLYDQLHKLGDSLGVATREELWRRIGTGELSAFAVAAHLNGSGAGRLLSLTNVADGRSRLLLDGSYLAGISYCDACMPLPGDNVIAVTSSSGARIHRELCASRGEGRLANEVFFPVWAARIVRALPARVRVHAKDRQGLLADCARTVSDCGINVTAVVTKSLRTQSDSMAILDFTVSVKSRQKLNECVESLVSVPGVRTAIRVAATDEIQPNGLNLG